jgi:predicted  nucleic acid-binding Zn-ribbon protein
MALSKDALLQVIALQKLDNELDKAKKMMEAIPVMVSNLKQALVDEKAKGAGAKNRVIELEKQKKEKELEMAKHEEDAKKHGAQLNSVKTNEAFRALQTEIGFAKQHVSDIETAILEIMELLDAAKREDKAVQAELGVELKKFEAEIAAHEKRYADQKAAFDAEKAKRDEVAAPLPVDVMKIYNHIRTRGKLDAIVPIDGTICSACRINLAPMIIVEATKLKSIVACESCQRILYRPEVLTPAKAA